LDGYYYIDRLNPSIYGPKMGGLWPSPIILGGGEGGGSSRMDSTDLIHVVNPGDQIYTLPVSNPSYIELYINGQLQSESAFSINGAVVTIPASVGLLVGDAYEFTYEVYRNAGSGGDSGGGSSSIPMDEVPNGAVNGINKVFNLSYVPIMNTLNIYVNGLRIDEGDYSFMNKTISFETAPNQKIRAVYYRNSNS
jgi:hypothetical protein